jgi:TRAP-type C4-dicarboxylate transport system permease small subunit
LVFSLSTTRRHTLKTLETLAKACAVLAGLLLTTITLMTCVSVVGRNTVGWTIAGDFELSGFAAGAAVALFLPLCQLRRGNIMVDFFTAKATAATQDRLDRFGAGLLALAMGLMTWRTAIGGINAWTSGSGSMMLGLPEWLVYVGLVPALALTTWIAAVQAWHGFDTKQTGTEQTGTEQTGTAA